MPIRTSLVVLVGLASLIGTACTEPLLVGERRDGSVGLDAAISFRADPCGNGVDDDGNGRIDDGCPCGPGETQACFGGALAAREVGTCSDGVQTCAGRGREWGDWGDSPCEGDTLPIAELCDGMDHDCDGARDEGCPCTAGEARECGVEFVVAPCRAGSQTCGASGAWGMCDGAIGPTAERCDDVDNDCDGVVDPGCGCVPEPERCRDGRDNDCDGVVDEPACTPDWAPDGGFPDGGPPIDPDAGIVSCTGPASCIDGIDVSSTPALDGDEEVRWAPRVAQRGDRTGIAWSNAGVAHVAVLAADGSVVGTAILPVPVADPPMYLSGGYLDIVATASGYRVGYVTAISTASPPYRAQLHVARIDASGGLLDVHSFPAYEYGTSSSRPAGAIAGPLFAGPGGSLIVLSTSADGARTQARFYDEDLVPLSAPPVDVAPVANVPVHSATLMGDDVVFGLWSPTQIELAYFRVGDTSARHVRVSAVEVLEFYDIGDIAVAASCDTLIACYRFFPEGLASSPMAIHEHRCHVVDAVGTVSPAFTLPSSQGYSNNHIDVVDVTWTGTEFYVRTERSYRSLGYAPPTEVFYAITPSGTVRARIDGPALTLPSSPIAQSPQGASVTRADGCVISAVSRNVLSGAHGVTEIELRRSCGGACR